MAGFFTRSKNDMKYLFAKKDSLSKKERKRKRRGWSTVIGIVLVLIQLILTILVLKNVITLDILPTKYLIGLTLFVIFVWLYDFTSQFSNFKILGKLLAILLSAVMLYSYIFSAKVVSTLSTISGISTTTEVYSVVVLESDKASSISDIGDYKVGYNDTVDSQLYKEAMDLIESNDKVSPEYKDYDSWEKMFDALYANKDIQAVLISNSSLTSLKETDETLDGKIKVIGTVSVVSKITVEKAKKVSASKPFVIFLSGFDEFDTLSYTGHSDVNILAVVNPETRQVLLVTTPRDSYVEIFDDNGGSDLDKLTHAGNFGVDNTIKTLENLYDGLDIDYFVRVNFTGCMGVVDALGGITVESETAFRSGTNAYFEPFDFDEGENYLDGAHTLAFVRERMAFKAEGDFRRGRNQIAAIKGIINKATSPAILTNYSAVLDAVSDMMLTDMPSSFITQLVKEQLSNGGEWNIQSYAVTAERTGYGNSRYFDLYGMSVDYLSSDSINMANELMTKIQNGDVFDVNEYVENANNEATTQSTTSSTNK